MVKKKLSKEEKYLLEKEIEALNESKDTDKFSFGNSINLFIALLFIMTSLVILFSEKNDFSYINSVFLWLFLFLAILFFTYLMWIKPIRDLFKKKHRMVRKRYEKLGVNLNYLEKELERTQL